MPEVVKVKISEIFLGFLLYQKSSAFISRAFCYLCLYLDYSAAQPQDITAKS